MQKRGSIARTLVYRPDVILMDEPFGALDAQTRMVMQDDLQALSHDAGASVLFVTHDITEAVLLADNVVVLSQRPSRLLANIPIELARPRNVFEPFQNPGYEAAYDAVWTVFRSQIDTGNGPIRARASRWPKSPSRRLFRQGKMLRIAGRLSAHADRQRGPPPGGCCPASRSGSGNGRRAA